MIFVIIVSSLTVQNVIVLRYYWYHGAYYRSLLFAYSSFGKNNEKYLFSTTDFYLNEL